MEERYIVSLDAGTSSCRSLLINHAGEIVSLRQKEISSFYPQSGWVEQDALEIWNTQLQTLQSLKSEQGIHTREIAAVGITNQRETIVIWDAETGLPVERAIVWQDRRGAAMCQRLKDEGFEEEFKARTGLTLDPYFSATKLSWLLTNSADAAKKLAEGRLLAGTIDTWLIWKLTNGASFVTDVTNASRTALFNIHTLDWDDVLLAKFGVPRSILPKVLPSNALFGVINPEFLSKRITEGVPIHGVAGDQQAALFGQTCFSKGELKNTYGTGCFALVNTGTQARPSNSGLLTTIAWQLTGEPVYYALEGSVFVAGAALKWLRDQLKLVHTAQEIDFYAQQAGDTRGIYAVHGYSGLGAPYWDPGARGAILGLELGTTREQVLAAYLEGIAYHSADLFSAMSRDLGAPLVGVAVDGGAARSDYLLQFQASIANLTIERPSSVETTALGAAYLAGLGVGYWHDQEELRRLRSVERRYTPALEAEEREERLKGWADAVRRILSTT